MRRCSSGTCRRQRGDVLIEALVGVLITGLLGASMAYVASRIVNSQREAKVENLAVEQMRDRLVNEGLALCGDPGLQAQGLLHGLGVTVGLTSQACADEGQDQALQLSITAGSASVPMALPERGYVPRGWVPAEIELNVEFGSEGVPLVMGTRQSAATRDGDAP